MRRAEIDQTTTVFYRTWRAGAYRLADGGGPFGFDIAVALLAHDLITRYGCDAIAETGCFLGDTTAYLARRYPRLPVYTCDVDPGCCAFTAHRLARCPNVTVSCEDSTVMLARVGSRHQRAFAFLDAHWAARWPLLAELNTLTSAVAMVHDFDIGHDRFSFDTYHGVDCGPGLLAQMAYPPEQYFVLDVTAALPLPCLQTGRRAGIAVITAGVPSQPLDASPYLTPRPLRPAAAKAAP